MYYAAYGSNLNTGQMADRCPDAEIVGTAVIKGYRLKFKGSKTGSYLTIEKAPGHEVPVGIWKVSKRDERALDRYEGYPSFYYKKMIRLECSDGFVHNCMIYIMHENRILERPSSDYVDTCMDGYYEFGFNPKYINDAIRYSALRRGYAV